MKINKKSAALLSLLIIPGILLTGLSKGCAPLFYLGVVMCGIGGSAFGALINYNLK